MPEHQDRIRALLNAMGRPSVVAETEAELEVLKTRGDVNRALAATALVMAHELDNPKPSLAMKAIAAKELREAMDRLLELAPPKRREDGIDQIAKQRARRRARVSKTASKQSS